MFCFILLLTMLFLVQEPERALYDYKELNILETGKDTFQYEYLKKS